MTRVAPALGFLAALALAGPGSASAAAGPGQHFGVVGFIDAIHDQRAGATQDTRWSIPLSAKVPGSPCSFRTAIEGRQQVEFRAPGQWGRYGSTTIVTVHRDGSVTPPAIEAIAQVERKVEVVAHMEEIDPACDAGRRGGPGIPRTTRRTVLPGCGIAPGTLRLRLRFVRGLRALRVRGTFTPDGGSLDAIFGQCNAKLLPDDFAAERDGGIFQHDYTVSTRPWKPWVDWWSADLASGRSIWAADNAVHRAEDFFRPGSRASSVLSMEVNLERDEVRRRGR